MKRMSIRKPVVGFLLLAVFHCGTYRPGVRAVPMSKAGTVDEKMLIRSASPNLPELVVLNSGEVEVDASLLLDLNNHPEIPNYKKYVPVMSYLIRHPQKGDVLIDTGFDESFSRSGHGNFSCMGRFFNFARQKTGTDIGAQLKQQNAKLTAVYFTHMHGDHTAGAPALARDIPYFAGKGTLADSYGDIFGLCMNHLDGIENISEIDFAAAPQVAGVGPVFDIFGDGSVWAILTPGHSAGHMSFVINTTTGPKLLTGDASHTAFGFRNNIAPGKVQNREQSRESLSVLRALAARHPEMRIYFGHDPDGSYNPEAK
jgi:N-acyl homoserine lactone hydrolase